VLCRESQLKNRKIVHLAYLDDSQQGSLAMFGALVIPHGLFGWTERMHSIAIEQIFPASEIEEKFQEFHAYELFKGEGAFKGIDEDKRFLAITLLLMAVRDHQLPFIYSAINTNKLTQSPLAQSLFETANPLVAAFKLCLLGVEKWAFARHARDEFGLQVDYGDQYLLIADETKDQDLKKRLRGSYRLLRAARPYTGQLKNRLWHAHDAMFFGDSRDSVGIQMADLCTYFMQRHLLKRNQDSRDKSDEFYDMFSGHAICAKPEPEWSQYKELLLSHENVSPLTQTS
jgi:hypothetical protein